MVGNGRRGVRIGILAAVAVLAAGCSDSGSATTSAAPTTAPPATSTTVTTTAPPISTTTTTVVPTSTTVDPLARPDKLVSNFDRDSVADFDTTGDDLYRIVLEIADLFNYLEGSPLDSAAAMADLLVAESYPFRQQIVRDFSELADNGWRYADPGIETVGIEVLEVIDGEAIVRVADKRGDQVIVDKNGDVAVTYDGWDLDVATFTYKRGDDGRWRYADVGPFLPATQADLESMVPIDWSGRKA
jgi:hypothetical protein